MSGFEELSVANELLHQHRQKNEGSIGEIIVKHITLEEEDEIVRKAIEREGETVHFTPGQLETLREAAEEA